MQQAACIGWGNHQATPTEGRHPSRRSKEKREALLATGTKALARHWAGAFACKLLPMADSKGKYAQCELKSGSTRRMCWLPVYQVRIGMVVTLKNAENSNRLWKVIWMGSDLRDKADLPSMDWDNNI